MSDNITPITPQHIESYITRYKDAVMDAGSDMRYEALCECIVEENPEYTMTELYNEWVTTEASKKEFAEQKFDAVVSEELRTHLTLSTRDTWVDATITGLTEADARNQ